MLLASWENMFKYPISHNGINLLSLFLLYLPGCPPQHMLRRRCRRWLVRPEGDSRRTCWLWRRARGGQVSVALNTALLLFCSLLIDLRKTVCFLYSAVSGPFDHSKHFTFFLRQACLFCATTRLLREVFSLAEITTRRLQ